MIYHLLADLIVSLHLIFILFAVLGGLLVLRWKRVVWAHLPAASWAAVVELSGWICPLTTLETWLRHRAGEIGYQVSFVEYYLIPVVYPEMLNRELQVLLGCSVLCLNVGFYIFWLWPRNR